MATTAGTTDRHALLSTFLLWHYPSVSDEWSTVCNTLVCVPGLLSSIYRHVQEFCGIHSLCSLDITACDRLGY